MISSSRSDEIADFIEFFAQVAGVKAAYDRVGATEEDIRRFRELARLPLPPLYVGYLREFGEKDPVLRLTGDAKSNVRILIQRYTLPVEDPDYEIPNNGVVIGGQSLSGQRLLVYSDTAQSAEADPAVTRGWWGEVDDTLAQNFRNYLYTRAFFEARWELIDRGPSFVLNANGHESFPIIIHDALNLGFEAYWFSDSWRQSLERTDGSVLFISRASSKLVVSGSFPNPRSRDQVKASLSKPGFVELPGY